MRQLWHAALRACSPACFSWLAHMHSVDGLRVHVLGLMQPPYESSDEFIVVLPKFARDFVSSRNSRDSMHFVEFLKLNQIFKI